jgi:hypothetical protein
MRRISGNGHRFITLLGIISFILISCDSAPRRSDKELYLAFCKDITERTRLVDVEYEPFAQAFASRDVAKILNVAKEIKARVRNAVSHLEETNVPALRDKSAHEMLKEAKVAYSMAYRARLEMLSNVIEFSKKPSPGPMIEFKKNREDYEKLSVVYASKLMAAGGKLGLKAIEIADIQVARSN